MPKGTSFDEPWQAQVLALAESMVDAGHFSAGHWADSLRAALRESEAAGAPDTDMTFYLAAVTALERLAEAKAGIAASDRTRRKHAWEDAYEHTPHGQPVVLSVDHHDHD